MKDVLTRAKDFIENFYTCFELNKKSVLKIVELLNNDFGAKQRKLLKELQKFEQAFLGCDQVDNFGKYFENFEDNFNNIYSLMKKLSELKFIYSMSQPKLETLIGMNKNKVVILDDLWKVIFYILQRPLQCRCKLFVFLYQCFDTLPAQRHSFAKFSDCDFVPFLFW